MVDWFQYWVSGTEAAHIPQKAGKNSQTFHQWLHRFTVAKKLIIIQGISSSLVMTHGIHGEAKATCHKW